MSVAVTTLSLHPCPGRQWVGLLADGVSREQGHVVGSVQTGSWGQVPAPALL